MNQRRPTETQRLFCALWPPAPVARGLADITATLHAQCGGWAVPAANQHITLAFLGNVTVAGMGHVQQALRMAAGQSAGFDLRLDKIVYRRRGGMFWARAGESPRALDALVRVLRGTLAALDFAVEERAFIAHVTLLRDARAPQALPHFEPLVWNAGELTLVRSTLQRSGARYDIVAREPLRAINL